MDPASITFGFGGYVETLANTGTFAACQHPACPSSSRMPLLPIAYAVLKQLSFDQRSIALLKAVTLSGISLSVALWFLVLHREREFPARLAIASGIALIFLSPLVIKNSSEIGFEEGVLTDLGFVLVVSLFALLRSARPSRGASAGALLAVLCSSFAYLAKSSMIGVHVVVIAVVLFAAHSRRIRTTLAIALIGLGLMPLAGWSLHNHVEFGRLSPGSSYDGVNLFRGWNETSHSIYPSVSLDRVMDSSEIALPDGSVIDNVERRNPVPMFKNEWERSDWYRRRAIDWFFRNPSKDLTLFGRKAYVMLIAISRYPSVGGQPYGEAAIAVSMLWMALARLVTIAALIVGLVRWRKGAWKPGAVDAWILVTLGAYCAPYLVGFAYQRHSIPFLVMGLTYCSALVAQWCSSAPFGEVSRMAPPSNPGCAPAPPCPPH